MAFRKPGETITDPSKFFIDEAYCKLKQSEQVHKWDLDNGLLNKPNLKFYIKDGLRKAFKEVEGDIDLDFPKDAKGLTTTAEFLKVMERYAPGFTAKHDLAMKTDDFRPMIDFLYPLSTIYEDNMKQRLKEQQQRQSKGFFAKLFS